MPKYSFTISSHRDQNPSVSDCVDDDAAKREAAGMFADVARDIANDLQSTPGWQIEVSDDAGRLIYTIKVAAESK